MKSNKKEWKKNESQMFSRWALFVVRRLRPRPRRWQRRWKTENHINNELYNRWFGMGNRYDLPSSQHTINFEVSIHRPFSIQRAFFAFIESTTTTKIAIRITKIQKRIISSLSKDFHFPQFMLKCDFVGFSEPLQWKSFHRSSNALWIGIIESNAMGCIYYYFVHWMTVFCADFWWAEFECMRLVCCAHMKWSWYSSNNFWIKSTTTTPLSLLENYIAIVPDSGFSPFCLVTFSKILIHFCCFWVSIV